MWAFVFGALFGGGFVWGLTRHLLRKSSRLDTATLLAQCELMIPTPQDRDMSKVPVADMFTRFPFFLLPELDPRKQRAIRAYVFWWMNEAAKDVAMRQSVMMQETLDAVPSSATHSRWAAEVGVFIEASEAIVKAGTEAQTVVQPQARENAGRTAKAS